MDSHLPDFVFVCVGPNCGERGGKELFDAWKARLLAEGRWDECRVVPASCFGQCATGPNACRYPNGEFQSGLDPARHAEALDALTAERTTEPA